MSGRSGKCPKCSATFKVPEKLFSRSAKPNANASASPATKSKTKTKEKVSNTPANPVAKKKVVAKSAAKNPKYRAQLLAALEQPIQPVRKSPLYAISSLLVTGVMILLPILYLAFIALTGYLVYWHLTNNQWLLTKGYGRARIFMMIAYAGPAIAGGIGVLFMFKPLFARPAKESRTRSLTRGGEPLLFEFVDRICEAVKSPKPAQINVDYQMNASAGFRRGIRSMLGNDLVLTIGLPLAAGLTLRQFAGVLAHEFGHFSQGVGMRLSYLIRSINHWFARVVYERDEWDEVLSESMSEADVRIGIVLAVASLFVMLSRGVLWVLMMIGNLVSGMLLRQMEYDADLYEARLVGNKVFAETCQQFELLNVSTAIAHQSAFQFFQSGKLADDFSQLTLHYLDHIPSKIRQEIKATEQESTSLLATHPSNKDRIASVNRRENPGVFRVEGRTRDLFQDFDSASKNVTWDFYCEVIGNVPKKAMRPVAELFDAEGKPDTAMPNRHGVREDLPPLSLD